MFGQLLPWTFSYQSVQSDLTLTFKKITLIEWYNGALSIIYVCKEKSSICGISTCVVSSSVSISILLAHLAQIMIIIRIMLRDYIVLMDVYWYWCFKAAHS